jgi:hypothetical protein
MRWECFLLIEDPTVNSRCIIGCIRSILTCLIPRVHLHPFPFLHMFTYQYKCSEVDIVIVDEWRLVVKTTCDKLIKKFNQG